MARPLRIEYSGAVYHVTARGNDRRKIFFKPHDYRHFLDLLAKGMERFTVQLHAYVLMSNHYHLVLRTAYPNLHSFMHFLNTAYTVWLNRINNRKGHLFEGRYKAIVMQEPGYLLSVSAYVHLNPVRVKAVKNLSLEKRLRSLKNYSWSSYHAYTQRVLESQKPKISQEVIWSELGARTELEAYMLYQEYIEGWLIKESNNPLANVKRGCCLGGEDFIDIIKVNFLDEAKLSDQIVAFDEWRKKMSITEVLKAVTTALGISFQEIQVSKHMRNEARDIVIYLSRQIAEKELKEIGEVLGIKTPAVSLAFTRVAKRISSSTAFANKLTRTKDEAIKLLKT